jgi:hypothetical protein
MDAFMNLKVSSLSEHLLANITLVDAISRPFLLGSASLCLSSHLLSCT